MTDISEAALSNDVNVSIGKRIYKRRRILGLRQVDLGDRIGTTHQQIQKYESGACNIMPYRLIKLAGALGVHISYFFNEEQPPA